MLLVCIVALLGSPLSLTGDLDLAPPGPVEVYQAVAEAFTAGDFERMAALMHPEALEQVAALMSLFALLPEEEDGFDDLPETFVAAVQLVDTLPPEALFIALLEFMTEVIPEFSTVAESMTDQVIGYVMEGEDMAHVVVRSSFAMDELSFDMVNVATMMRHEGEWRAGLSGDLSLYIQGMHQALDDELQQLHDSNGPRNPADVEPH